MKLKTEITIHDLRRLQRAGALLDPDPSFYAKRRGLLRLAVAAWVGIVLLVWWLR